MIKRQYLYLENKMYFLRRIKYIKQNLDQKSIDEVILDSLCLKNTWLYGVSY